MNGDVLFAGVAVSDLETSVSWYDRLFGAPPDMVVNDDEVIGSAGRKATFTDPEGNIVSFVEVQRRAD